MADPYELFGTEKKVLASPPELLGVNVSDVLSGVRNKLSESMKNLVKYSVYLDRMEDSKYTPAAEAKEIVSNANDFRLIFTAILNSESIAADRKLDIAATLLDISSDYIISKMNDPMRKKAITRPLNEAMKDLSFIINENKKNASWGKINDFMKRREQRVSRLDRIVGIRLVQGQWLAVCMSCVQSGNAQDLKEAVYGVVHDRDCIYKNERESKSFEQILLHYKTVNADVGIDRLPAAPGQGP